MGSFQVDVIRFKITAMQLQTRGFLNTIKSFQMRYCMNFPFKKHKNSQNSKVQKSSLLVILMPFVVKAHYHLIWKFSWVVKNPPANIVPSRNIVDLSFPTLVFLIRLSLKLYFINLKNSSTMFWGRLCSKVDYV